MLERFLPAAACAALLCAVPAPALSQQTIPMHGEGGPRGYLEYYATGASRSAGDANGGFGARLGLRVGSSAALLGRGAVGGYAARIPASPGFGRTEYGLQTELSARRGAGLDPLLTLGLGAVRRDGRWVWRIGR